MKRMTCAPDPLIFAIAGIIAIVGACGLSPQAAADESFTRVAVSSSPLTVDLGRAVVFQTQVDIQDVRVADGKVCSVEVIGNNRKSVSVVGLKRGTTTITVTFNRPNALPQTYITDVVTAPDTYRVLADFIHQQYPNSSIVLTPVPTSQKVVVSGAASSCAEWEAILKLLEGGGIAACDLIIRATVPWDCGCQSCCYPHWHRR
jgi:hypothetical protein